VTHAGCSGSSRGRGQRRGSRPGKRGPRCALAPRLEKRRSSTRFGRLVPLRRRDRRRAPLARDRRFAGRLSRRGDRSSRRRTPERPRSVRLPCRSRSAGIGGGGPHRQIATHAPAACRTGLHERGGGGSLRVPVACAVDPSAQHARNCGDRVKLIAPAALGLTGSRAGTRSGRRRLAVSDSQRGVGELLGERGRFLSVAA
jgi:hypothetical protein